MLLEKAWQNGRCLCEAPAFHNIIINEFNSLGTRETNSLANLRLKTACHFAMLLPFFAKAFF